MKAPCKVAFFVDNLIKRRKIIVDWYCMSKIEKTIDHLLLHCSVATDFGSFNFVVFGVRWVMSKSLLAPLQCWQKRLHSYRNKVWNVVP